MMVSKLGFISVLGLVACMIEMVSEIEKAYVAGFIDGEAGLSIAEAVTKLKGRWFQPSLDISNNNEEVLEYIKLLYGGE